MTCHTGPCEGPPLGRQSRRGSTAEAHFALLLSGQPAPAAVPRVDWFTAPR